MIYNDFKATDFPPSNCNHQYILISCDPSREALGQETGGGEEKKLLVRILGQGCCAKLQLIFIDLLVFGSFAKIRPYLAPEPLAASIDVLQRFLPPALSSFILVNIKI